MIRGTTPTLYFNLPFETSLVKSAEIYIKYTNGEGENTIVKTLSSCECGDASIYTKLTQEETLLLSAPTNVLIQLRVLLTDGTALATDTYEVAVKNLLKEGVIE